MPTNMLVQQHANAVYLADDFGAAHNGVHDDTAALQAAINACGNAGTVLLSGGVYLISSPLSVPQGAHIQGAMAPFYGTPTTNCSTIAISAGFSGAAAIIVNDASGTGPMSLSDLLLYGGNQVSGSVVGFQASGGSGPAISLTRVSVNHFQGINIQFGDATHTRRGIRCVDVNAFYSDGASSECWYINTTDSILDRCMAFQGTHGFHVIKASNTTFANCRAEHNKVAGYGWFFDACVVTGGMILSGCSTDQNDGDGFHFENLTNDATLGGSGVIQVSACFARRDGNNGGSGGGSYCGINIVNCAVPIILTGDAVTVERGDTSGWGPTNGLRVASSFYVDIEGGIYTATSTPIVDGGSNTTFRRGPNIMTGVNTSGTTTWTANDGDLYRSGSNAVKTDGAATVGGNFAVIGTSSLDNGKIITNGNGSQTIALGSADVAALSVSNSSANANGAQLQLATTANTGRILNGKVTGDAVNRYNLRADGLQEWGDGTNARDTNLYRSAASTLKTDNNLAVAGTSSLDNGAITTNGSGNMVTSGAVDATHAIGVAMPREHGIVAWAFDPANVSTGKAGVAQTLYVISIYVNRSTNVTKIYWGVNAGGSGPTTAHNAIGLFNASGTLLQSAAIVDGHITGTGLWTETISSQAVTPGKYYVGILIDASGMPQIYRGQDLNATLLNAGISTPSANVRFGTAGTSLTSLASFTAANVASAQFAYWAAIG